MNIFGTFISVAVLWFLITLFTRSTSSSRNLNEAWIVVIGMLIVRFVLRHLLGGVLGLFTIVLEIGALYLLVDKICGTSRATTIRICVWYFVVSFLINLFFYIILS